MHLIQTNANKKKDNRQTAFISHSKHLFTLCMFLLYLFLLCLLLECVFLRCPPCVCFLCLWSTGAPLHCSSASSSPVDSPYPPPSHAANQSQGRLLGNSGAQAGRDSESEDEFAPNSFLVKTGSGNVCTPASASANGEFL